MHQSGIVVDDELRNAFNAHSENESVAWVKMTIENEKFVIVGTGNTTGSEKGNWESLAATCETNIPFFGAIRRDAKWLMIAYIPDTAKVFSKMIFASSLSSLRTGIGGARWVVPDFSINLQSECTLEAYEKTLQDVTRAVMSYNEKESEKTHRDAALMMGTEATAIIPGVPIKIAEATMEQLKTMKEGGSPKVIELILDPKTEVLGTGKHEDMTIAAISGSLPEKEPRYFVINWGHKDREGADQSKFVFVYYCPGAAPPRLKMFYSTCKSHVITCLSKLEYADPIKLECSEAADFSEERLINEAYPIVQEEKTFAKPKAAKGRGKARIAKFQA